MFGAGYDKYFPSGSIMLKKEQKDAIESFILGRDTFVSLPTGIGKLIELIVPLANEFIDTRTNNELST